MIENFLTLLMLIVLQAVLGFDNLLYISLESKKAPENKQQYVRNYDGDTITFNLPNLHPIIGEKISDRVNGIDTPEIKGNCEKEKYDAQQAKEMVADILKDAEQITLKHIERGKYFRIAADVLVDGEDLGGMLVEAGVAVKYDGGKKSHKWCK